MRSFSIYFEIVTKELHLIFFFSRFDMKDCTPEYNPIIKDDIFHLD